MGAEADRAKLSRDEGGVGHDQRLRGPGPCSPCGSSRSSSSSAARVVDGHARDPGVADARDSLRSRGAWLATVGPDLGLAIALALAVVLGVAAGVGAHLVFRQSASATGMPLPDLHDKRSGLPDSSGPRSRSATSSAVASPLASTKGRPTLVTFLDSKCRSLCPIVGREPRGRAALASRGGAPCGARRERRSGRRHSASVRSAARRWALSNPVGGG